MDKTLCGISALRLLRVPPQYLSVLPCLPDFDTPYGRQQIRDNYTASKIVGIPIHALEFGAHGINSTLVKPHVWTTSLPHRAIIDTPFDVSLTSPLFTALLLARHISTIHLAMLLYEFMGTFTVFSPSKDLDEAYARARRELAIPRMQDWKRLVDTKGSATNMWTRPPLFTSRDLELFLSEVAGQHGYKPLQSAAHLVTGSVASPFEARASLLLTAPRATGGLGLTGMQNDLKIELNDDARKICGLRHVYADLAWEKTSKHPFVVVECQGKAVHGSPIKGLTDDNRALALQNMGIEVIRITYEQIADERRFEIFGAYLAKKLGVQMRSPAPKTARATQELREQLFCDWEQVGLI